jgi:hypothetical protein
MAARRTWSASGAGPPDSPTAIPGGAQRRSYPFDARAVHRHSDRTAIAEAALRSRKRNLMRTALNHWPALEQSAPEGAAARPAR